MIGIICHLPLVISSGPVGVNDAKPAANCPPSVDLFDQRGLKIRIAHAVESVARRMIGRDRILGNKRQIGAKSYLP
jgi:hypothetical protein